MTTFDPTVTSSPTKTVGLLTTNSTLDVVDTATRSHVESTKREHSYADDIITTCKYAPCCSDSFFVATNAACVCNTKNAFDPLVPCSVCETSQKISNALPFSEHTREKRNPYRGALHFSNVVSFRLSAAVTVGRHCSRRTQNRKKVINYSFFFFFCATKENLTILTRSLHAYRT